MTVKERRSSGATEETGVEQTKTWGVRAQGVPKRLSLLLSGGSMSGRMRSRKDPVKESMSIHGWLERAVRAWAKELAFMRLGADNGGLCAVSGGDRDWDEA